MPGDAGMAGQLATALARSSGSPVKVDHLQRLTGGANKETWSFDLVGEGGEEPLILRRMPGGADAREVRVDKQAGDLDIEQEGALVTAAGRAGVPVPTVRYVLSEKDELGAGYVMSREPGEALPFRLLGDDRYEKARAVLASQCGEALGRIHQIPLASLPPGLADHSGEVLFERAQELLDSHGNVSPVLQLGLNWLRTNAGPESRRTLVHGDFRNGNLLVDENGLTAVLDWELAHIGNPLQDLGYITANVWRFGASPPVGGFGEYADLLAGYTAVTGESVSLDEIYYWQVHAALSWGMVCLIMLDMYRSGEDASLERAAVGRRLSEAEIDLLLLLDEDQP